MTTPTVVAPTPPAVVARAPLDVTLPSTIALPTSLINSVLSQIPTDYGTYQLPSSVPDITIHYSSEPTSPTPTPSSSSSSDNPATSSSTTPSSSSTASSSHHSSNTSLLAGVFVAVGLLALLLLILLFWCLRRRRRRQKLDQDMAEAAVVPRGTVSRSRFFPHLRGGNVTSFGRSRSLLTDTSSFMRPAGAASAGGALVPPETPPADLAGVGTYGARRRSSIERLGRPGMRSPLSPTYTEIMSPHQRMGTLPPLATLPTSESGYTPYVPPVHHEGYFPPAFQAPDNRYAALTGAGVGAGLGAGAALAHDPFADDSDRTSRTTPSTGEEPTDGAAYAHRAGLGPYEDPHYPFPQTPGAGYYPDGGVSEAESAALMPGTRTTNFTSSGEESEMVFAPAEAYRPPRRSGSGNNYGQWFSGGGAGAGGVVPPTAAGANAGSSSSSSEYWSGSSEMSFSQAGAAIAHGGGGVPFPSASSPTMAAAASRSTGGLASIPEARPPPPSGPETPAELSDESDYRIGRRLTVTNQ